MGLDEIFQNNKLARAASQKAAVVPLVDANPLVPCSLPNLESFAFYNAWEEKLQGEWRNEVVIVRSLEACRAFDPLCHRMCSACPSTHASCNE